ncbi:class I SAM-dependent methyltransferase, partial [Paenibacillus sp. Marseille-Q4541]|uniref:class I SAM-dependent methyltransferase n=1 Tax=Paenibacillus sp. Marseille-Q4541 TaxID=2831522 RepID=UPI001BA8E585
MNDLLFDQYQRYKNVADAIQSMRDGTSCLKILEVGANEHQNLEKFLPNDDIKYLDVELPERLLSNPNYFLGDATKMEFPDKSFDVVVALDVYEHIPASKRKSFISEINRVSSNFFIITAPFKSKRVSESEQRVNSIFKILFGHNFRWLEEHFENGLPEEQELEDVMNSLDVKFRKLNHGDLNIWETMMGIHFFAARIPQLITYREKIDQFYNNYLYEKDYTAESY